ncbi:Uncharacterised protein [Moraxella caviae]|uniref:Uncharacterized protein n=1 Tax=Moraxella caviae TaxID=34060 RepID=A0A378R4V4_9GAMM|nr:Uncharacterised protein [Moraxella caviae]
MTNTKHEYLAQNQPTGSKFNRKTLALIGNLNLIGNTSLIDRSRRQILGTKKDPTQVGSFCSIANYGRSTSST